MQTYLVFSGAANVCVSGYLSVWHLRTRPRVATKIYFGAVCASVALWSAFYLGWQLAKDRDTALLLCRLLLVPAGFIGPLFYHHIALLIERPPRRLTLYSIYGLALLNAVFCISGYSVSDVAPLFELQYWPRAGDGFIVFLASYSLLVVGCIVGLRAARNTVGYRAESIRLHCLITLAGVAGGFTNLPGWVGIAFPPLGNALVSLYLIGSSYSGHGALAGRRSDHETPYARGLLIILGLCGLAAALTLVSMGALTLSGGGPRSASAWLVIFGYHGLLVLVCYLVIPRVVDFESRIWQFLRPSESDIVRALTRLEAILPSCGRDEVGPLIVRELEIAAGGTTMALYLISNAGDLRLAATSRSQSDIPASLPESSVLVQECARHGGTVTLKWLDLGPGSEWAAQWHTAIPVVADRAVTVLLLLDTSSKIGTQMLDELELALLRIHHVLQTRQFATQIARQDSLLTLGHLAAGVAHEVRNPLTSIKTYVELAHRGNLRGEDESALYKEVHAGIERMLGAIEAVSAYADNRSSERAEVCLREVVDQTAAMCAAEVRRASVTIENATPVALKAWANRRELLQIFANLLTNAAEAMAPHGGGVITVDAEPLPSRRLIRVRVVDTGPGLPESIAARLGRPFTTTKTARFEPGRKSGYGLGLSIVMDRIVAHGGTLTYEAPAFIFTLPAGQPNGAVATLHGLEEAKTKAVAVVVERG